MNTTNDGPSLGFRLFADFQYAGWRYFEDVCTGVK